MPARNIFGWQKPCYLLGEGYTKTFKELQETTDWNLYGTGKYEKCATVWPIAAMSRPPPMPP
jgi:hypothetical protein